LALGCGHYYPTPKYLTILEFFNVGFTNDESLVYLCIQHLWIVRRQLFGSIILTNAEPFDNLMNLTKPIHVKMLIVDTRNPKKTFWAY
jgi:hypothetical protein